MPRRKSSRRSKLMKRRHELRRMAGLPFSFPVKTFVSLHGTGDRHRTHKWPTSNLTNKQVKFVFETQDPDKKNALVIGDQHLRAMVDKSVAMPEGLLSYSFLAFDKATASEIRAELFHTDIPLTPDIVCVLATSNGLLCRNKDLTDVAKEFAALLFYVRKRWEKALVLDFPTIRTRDTEEQAELHEKFHCIAATLGLPFVPAADHFPLDQLQLWSTDGKHLSDTFGTPVLVDLLHTAAICYLATREPHVPCQISPSCGPTDAADEVKVAS